MATLDFDLVRHALNIARDSGLDEVELELGDSKFTATIGKKTKKAAPAAPAPSFEVASAETGPATKPIKAGSVGIYRIKEAALTEDQVVAKGDVVGAIVALGISNDVVSPVGGKITEVLVKDGQAVEYGQAIATVELS
jgi:acetyl-CoA carboxylase biotin carboxyl carrier protein